ncbi:glycosyltransferase family 2 protein [Dechloromonas denitrificans]|uniref:glycosyltransferase family 2 protein n=1 Tax=Dechloromonas denitrificans TaxID=281362 RepID=UPI000ABB58DC|nr:glycosyltransferase family 2 protein [Dechloromonas denitrificans]
MIAVSIVSHGHGAMVARLIASLSAFPEVQQIILTRNIPEALGMDTNAQVSIIDNGSPKGFGENHNAAFAACNQPYFCPLNPDVELPENPFPGLLNCARISDAALVAPRVVTPEGATEDNMRYFPNFRSLLTKAFGGKDGRFDVSDGQPDFCPDWVAGMFMLFRSEDFARLKGFDEGFFLYYEDVDICVRIWLQGLRIVACPSVTIVHDARRHSRRNLQYLRWHLTSMGRHFRKHWGRMPSVRDRRVIP